MSHAGDGTPGLVRRLREGAVALALVAVAFSQAPGLVDADTKLDLVLDPARFLSRALLAWDETAAFGQLQNQAYGYLFPMGPFFLAGHLLGLPAWVTQRLWWSLLLVVAYTGVLRLTRLLGIGTHTTRLLAASAYALSPRVLTTVGGISIESWPLALAPWVLVPLVRGARAGSVRRAAMASALVVAAVGGVNAAATLAVLPPALLFLITREPGRRRRELLAWWSGGVVLATAWWVLPLLVLGRYAFPFLDYIETASVTSSVTSLTNALRGTSHWLAFVPQQGAPLWTAGWWLASSSVAVLATTAVAAAGLVGLAHRRMPERRFLVLTLLLGVTLVAVGHAGTVSSPLSGPARQLLDGPLAPFRTVHKADLMLRLPLTLGLCHLLAVMPERLRAWRRRVPAATAQRLGVPSADVLVAGTVALALGVLAAATWPAYRGDLPARGPFASVPGYWAEASDWLDARPQGRTLVVPGAAFGDYGWGRPADDPLQAYADRPWAVRNAVPLGAPGATRLLDGIGAELAAGRPSPGLAAALARAGVGRVLLRNDIDPLATADPAAATRATLTGSPGLRRVARFGPVVGGTLGQAADATGPFPQARALEVFEVSRSAPPVVELPSAGVSVLSGAAEATLGLVAPATDPPALVTRSDAAPLPGTPPWLVTDTNRRRSLDFGATVGAGYSQTLPAGTDPRRGRPAGDVLADEDPAHQTSVSYAGASAVDASSTAADPSEAGWRGPGTRPYAAFDGDPTTSWVSSTTPEEQWVELRWARPRVLGRIAVALSDEPDTREVDRLRIETDAGAVGARLTQPDAHVVAVQPPAGPTRRLRVVVPRQATG
ncbi:MAG TPA: alpha-(1-_3)-arabinofuranosyltransferase family protein, partial [Actinomycetes bacterium]